jgi:PadR family transcriptional regulator, regulatory protein PadR
MPTQGKDRLHGTLDALVLKTLAAGPRHGYAISRWLRERSAEAIVVEEGSLYPALYRLEHQGLIKSEWGESENRRKAKYYRLSAAGRRRFKEETAYWRRFSEAMGFVLEAMPEDL